VQKEYQKLREEIVLIQEESFLNKKQLLGYDEYIYIPKTKSNNKSSIFDGFNFLTYNYDNKIYNILLPSLKRYKPKLIEDNMQEVYFKELEKFLLSYHLSNKGANPLIEEFWQYFEDFILKFNGINSDNFIYYLKEAEFKFNNLNSTLYHNLKV
jgi:transposase-like protein